MRLDDGVAVVQHGYHHARHRPLKGLFCLIADAIAASQMQVQTVPPLECIILQPYIQAHRHGERDTRMLLVICNGWLAVVCLPQQVMHDQPGQVTKCYDKETLLRLQQLKACCDPLGLLRALT